MGELSGLLIAMFFLVLGVAFIGGCVFILFDLLLQSTDGEDSERRF